MRKLTSAFARIAARGGWRASVLDRFCEWRGIGEAERMHMWPRGIRSLSWDFNANTDREMVALYRGHPANLENVILTRLDRNRSLKPAVARLAWSDLRHPVDTLQRTYVTAGAMLDCSGNANLWWRRGRLTIAYCFIVLVWLADGSRDQRTTRRATRLMLRLTGMP